MVSRRTALARKTEERRRLALARARRVCEYLKGLGAADAFVIGSVLHPEQFHPHSDVDFVVVGLPDIHMYRVEGRIEEILEGMPFDLIYLDTLPEEHREFLIEKGMAWKEFIGTL
ncbi:MAG: nucleotidyltransferase domain-containing protein [Desulfacinum sp.]|nr:nucleotidyltransferase domain-containing protein [Desulfacinum sp.]